MEVLVPRVPGRLRITQTMVEDFLCDPVLAAKVLLSYDLDAFQRARLRYYWWVRFGIDDSGFSSGKTIVDWIYIALRCLLIPDHVAAVYYPVFQTGKETFWPYYTACRSPIFKAHLGRTDERGEVKGKARLAEPACWKAFYLNGSVTMMPAPNFVRDAYTQASMRFNTLLVEEWRYADAMGDGIDKQLLGRTTRPSFNQEHPIWGNHIHLTAPAKDSIHPSDKRWREFHKEVRRGNPTYFLITYCYKDYSNLVAASGKTYRQEYRQDAIIGQLKKSMSEVEFLGEGLGIRGRNGRALYQEEWFTAAREAGKAEGLMVVTSRLQDSQADEHTRYFLGIDPAPAQSLKSDDGALVILRARPAVLQPGPRGRVQLDDSPLSWRLGLVYARKVRNASSRQWSGLIHGLHQRFRFAKIGMDKGGGGQWIKKDLSEPKQLIENVESTVRPIAVLEDVTVADGDFVLVMIGRDDNSIVEIWPDMAGDDVLLDRQHTTMEEALRNGAILFPPGPKEIARERTQSWPEERIWALRNSDTVIDQFVGLAVLLKETGEQDMTKNNARKFVARGKKDFVSGTLNAYTAFLCWLKQVERDEESEDDVMFSGYAR